MSFLDNFSFAFQQITFKQKNYTVGKYGEKIQDSEIETVFFGVIQKKKDYAESYLDDKNKSIRFTSMDFELRSPVDIAPKKGDSIESNGLNYDVIYPYPPVIISGKHDHNVCIIRLID